MNKILRFLLYYALIPFFACLPGLVLTLFGVTDAANIAVPVFAGLIYFLFRKKTDADFAAKVNGAVTLILLVVFTAMMIAASGEAEGTLMSYFSWCILPFAPVMLFYFVMGQRLQLFITAVLTYAVSYFVTAFPGKIKLKKMTVPSVMAACCIAVSSVLYINRPSVRYAGHGFEYMHGYSSTDFTDYMVYSDNSKLAAPDSGVPFIIENESDMPVMDGAEACYPLYAAFAKAAYKDIDIIEKKWLDESDMQYRNGKIVTFTNSVQGFKSLIFDTDDPRHRTDMFFGARPSASQIKGAEEMGVELEITPVAREAFVFFTESDNPVDNLTSEQIRSVYHGDITDWSELGGKNQKIIAFQRPENSGSQTMMEYFMGDVSLKEPKTYEKSRAMMGVIKEVAQYHNEEGAVGYSFRYFLEELNQEKGVKMTSVDGVYPSPENIDNGTYPLITNVCLITRKNDNNPYVKKMTDFILSEEGQCIVRKTGYAGVRENSFRY